MPKIKNALLKASEGGGYHGIMDNTMTAIVGYSVIESAQASKAETYTFRATIDERTTDICRYLNMQKLKVSDMKLGWNVPPISTDLRTGLPIPHHCRSWIVLPSSSENDLLFGGISGIMETGALDKHKTNTINITPQTAINIEMGKQEKHIKGTNNYQEGKSYITISVEELQQLVNKYSGTGRIPMNKKGNQTNKEIITVDHNIGVCVNEMDGSEVSTNRFVIHHSKKGVHIVPTFKKETK